MESWPLDVVLAQSKAHDGTRFVLALIAGHWNAATGVAFPGNRRLAAMAGCSTSTIARRIRALVDLGELEIAERGGGHRSARFRLPALDYPVLAIDSGGSLEPIAIDPDRIATAPGSLAIDPERIATARAENGSRSASDPFSASSDPLAISPGRIGSRSEVEELRACTRARARARDRVRRRRRRPREAAPTTKPNTHRARTTPPRMVRRSGRRSRNYGTGSGSADRKGRHDGTE